MTLRPTSPGAEARLNRPIPVLDHGYVELLDYMGTDRDVVLAARTTTATEDAKAPSEDRALLRYLVRHRHTTPLEMVRARFRIQLPIFVARQLVRHRMSSLNEYSLRYSEPIEALYVPAAEHVAAQATANRQGRGATLEPAAADRVRALLTAHGESSLLLYDQLADELGVARELARVVLPVSLYTRWVWTIDLHNLMHLLSLRLDPHAQLEIRVFADALAAIVRDWVPLAWEAFEDYRLGAVTLTRAEVRAVGALMAHLEAEFGHGDDDRADRLRGHVELYAGLKGRELDEAVAKLLRVRAAAEDV